MEVLIPLTFFCDTKSHTVTEKVTPLWYEHTYVELTNNCNKVNEPVAFAARFRFRSARARLSCGFAGGLGAEQRNGIGLTQPVWPGHPEGCLYVRTEGGSERLACDASESDRLRRDGGNYR